MGVTDNGKIVGVANAKKIENDFTTAANNFKKLNPAYCFSVKIVELRGKTIVYIYVPESSQLHKVGNKIFVRNGASDFDISMDVDRVAALYMKKQSIYSENRVILHIRMKDLRSDLFDRVRKLVKDESGKYHPWHNLSNLELLKSAGMYRRDMERGKYGITLAGVLIFGKDDAIINALPHYRIDAVVRIKDIDRYDDRDDIRTNLLDSYDRLMHFIEKHLPDPFFLEGDRRVSLRNKIFREAISNILIHREYISRYPARLVIESGRVLFENFNRPHIYGRIMPSSFSPYPKNPAIARLFKEIGYADELGSGVRNMFKYCEIYSGNHPEIIEDDIVKIIIYTPQVIPQAVKKYSKSRIMEFCREARSRKEIQEYLGIKDREYFRREILRPLIDEGILQMTIPDKPNSPKQKYYTVR